MNDIKKATHTPGPWRVNTSEMDGWFADVYAGEAGLIARVPGYSGDPKTPAQPEERKANARLIAAAPDLLEALKQVRSYMGFAEGRDPSGMRLIDALDLMDTVIAKAEGR